MKAYGQPQLVKFGDGNKYGYTLVQLIETSSIVAHFCEEDNAMYLDIFSCKDFSSQIALLVIHDYFKPFKIKYSIVERQAME